MLVIDVIYVVEVKFVLAFLLEIFVFKGNWLSKEINGKREVLRMLKKYR